MADGTIERIDARLSVEDSHVSAGQPDRGRTETSHGDAPPYTTPTLPLAWYERVRVAWWDAEELAARGYLLLVLKLKLSELLSQIKKGTTMSDLKTTVTGFITAALALLSHFGIVVPAGLETVILAVGSFVAFYFSKDKGGN